ncbi:MAG: hypothetical protein ACTSUC_19570 [Promethearchaeota archaeon]
MNFDLYSFTLLKRLIDENDDHDWQIIMEHLTQAIKHLEKGINDPTYYRDSISRANKVFEGVVKKLYAIANSLSLVRNNLNSIGIIIDELERSNIIPPIFKNKFNNYKNNIRNEETHEVFRQFNRVDSEKALKDSFIFIFLGLELEKRMPNNHSFSEMDILLIYLNSFLKSFNEYTILVELHYENVLGYIYPVNKKTLKTKLLEFYNTSVFKNEFFINHHPSVNRLKPDFKVTYDSESITFTIIKIDERSSMHTTLVQKVEKRLIKYKTTFNKLYFLLWFFTRRISVTDEICAIFKNCPHYVLYQIKKKDKRIFQRNKSIAEFYKI